MNGKRFMLCAALVVLGGVIGASAGEMILEGLYSIDKISRSEERGYTAPERKSAAQELYRDYTMERNRYKKPLN